MLEPEPSCPQQSARGPQMRQLLEWSERLKPLFRPKRLTSPGDWLAVHPEPGQSFEEYVKSNPNCPRPGRDRIYLQPLGTFPTAASRLIEEAGEFIHRFYGLPTVVRQPEPLRAVPAYARRVHPTWGDRQLLTSYLLEEVLLPRRPPDAVAMLGLTAEDLWPGEGWNFVFGQASLREGVGVWSLYRYGDPETEPGRVRKRLLKTAVHELGHMLGMLHCIAYECGMNGSNSLAEMDRRPLAFCPVCVLKLWWATAVDPVARYQRLVEYAQRLGLAEEATFWQACLERLQS